MICNSYNVHGVHINFDVCVWRGGVREQWINDGCVHHVILVQVFLEVLRLYPPGVGTSRESPDDNFHLSGYAIPKETMIALSFYANHRNPDNWDDPETFDPSRFSPARGK